MQSRPVRNCLLEEAKAIQSTAEKIDPNQVQKALDLLRSNSALKAEKKSGRVAADGLLVSIVTDTYVKKVDDAVAHKEKEITQV